MNSTSATSSVVSSRGAACCTRTRSASRPSGVTFQTPIPPLPRFCFSTRAMPAREARREPGPELVDRGVQARIGTPTEIPGAVEHLLRAHLQDRVRMRAHPSALRRDISQERVEDGAIVVATQWIDPDQHTVEPGQMLGEVCGVLAVQHRLHREPNLGQRREDRRETIVISCLRDRRGGIAAPDSGNPRRPSSHRAQIARSGAVMEPPSLIALTEPARVEAIRAGAAGR